MALTYVPTFFHKLGFETVAMDTLPEKVWGGVCVKCYKYNNCDETAVLSRVGWADRTFVCPRCFESAWAQKRAHPTWLHFIQPNRALDP
jgi:hypothetical protein